MKKPRFPFSFGYVHFVGIGGIGMSGIAEIMHSMGYKVKGSDSALTPNVERLMKLGIDITIGHKPENIDKADVVVRSSAVKSDNCEIKEAENRMIPVIHRSAMLAELMKMGWSIAVGGTHGKTTTTSLISTVLIAGGKDPTIVNGGIINSLGTNARVGEGDWMVVEADESDGSFTVFPSTVTVITNIDADHLDHYTNMDEIKESFTKFANKVPFYGLTCVCIDNPAVQEILPDIARPVLTYGLNQQADIAALNIKIKPAHISFDVAVRNRKKGTVEVIENFCLPMYGEHNVKNALAAIGIGLKVGIDVNTIKSALANFRGVKRRFTKIGEVNGITFIDDYAHHPTEIMAVLKGARAITDKKIIAVFQPHRFTRLKNLYSGFCSAFNDADIVIATDVYSAGEQPIEGINKEYIATGIKKSGHQNASAASLDEIPNLIAANAAKGDFVIFLGAGNISAFAHTVPDKLLKIIPTAKESNK